MVIKPLASPIYNAARRISLSAYAADSADSATVRSNTSRAVLLKTFGMVGYKIKVDIAILYQYSANGMVQRNIRTGVYLQMQVGNSAGIGNPRVDHNDFTFGLAALCASTLRHKIGWHQAGLAPVT
jgi:hypothetical protein